MIVLGMDTSGYANAIGLADGSGVLAARTFDARTDSLEQIVDNIDTVLKEAGLGMERVQGIGVGLGPGSWTGIRVGVTVAKMLAFSTGRPLAGIPTLEALAYQAGGGPSLRVAVVSAGAGSMVYAAFYQVYGENLKNQGDYFFGDLAGLAGRIGEDALIIGEDAPVWGESIAGLTRPGVTIKTVPARPDGGKIAWLARWRLVKGDSDDVLSLSPLYLKESTARAYSGRKVTGAP